jgi:hypothetical protein
MSFPSRSKAACISSCESLWQPGGRVYFWTVTFKRCRDDWVQSAAFSAFLDALRHDDVRHCAVPLGGVKVGELHPGGHGLHFHFLCNKRVSVHTVRRLGGPHGIGRVFVEVADNNAAAYMAKYLTKSRGKAVPRTHSGRRMRLWACFGAVPRRCRCKDLVFHSPMWDFRRARGFGFLGWRFEPFLERAWFANEGSDAFIWAWYRCRDGDWLSAIKASAVGYEVRRDGSRGELVLVEIRSHRLPVVNPF